MWHYIWWLKSLSEGPLDPESEVWFSVDEEKLDISAEAYSKLISALDCTENYYKCTACLLNI